MLAQLLDGFIAEARDIAQRVTGHILALEHAEGEEPVREKHYQDLARGLHTLKGNASTFGFPHLAELGPRMEEVIARLAPALAPIPDDVTDLLLRAIDVFIARLASRSTNEQQ